MSRSSIDVRQPGLRVMVPALALALLAAVAVPASPVQAAASAGPVANPAGASSSAPAVACPPVLDRKAMPLTGDAPVPLCQFAGKVVLVVNTASECGFTYQYEGLEKTWKRYRARGLVVLGFPANDFGAQEPGGNKQIAEFCRINYGVSFPMFEKLDEPIARNPLFAGLIAATGQAPRWNFHKYLIDRDGKVTSFSTNTEPDSPVLQRAIETALAARRN